VRFPPVPARVRSGRYGTRHLALSPGLLPTLDGGDGDRDGYISAIRTQSKHLEMYTWGGRGCQDNFHKNERSFLLICEMFSRRQCYVVFRTAKLASGEELIQAGLKGPPPGAARRAPGSGWVCICLILNATPIKQGIRCQSRNFTSLRPQR
jgi:hypothetical protein